MPFLHSLFGQRTRRGRCPIAQRGEFSVRPSERTSERTNVRPVGPLRVQPPPPDPSPSALSRPQPPRPLDPPQAPAPLFQTSSHPPPLSPRPRLPLESPCPPRTDGKFTPLCYRTSSPSGPLPCLNLSILKKTAQGQ